MKKTYLICSLMLTAMLVVTGCGNKVAENPIDEATAQEIAQATEEVVDELSEALSDVDEATEEMNEAVEETKEATEEVVEEIEEARTMLSVPLAFNSAIIPQSTAPGNTNPPL